MDTHDSVVKRWLGFKYEESPDYGYQCVAWVKKYVQERYNVSLGRFGDSAINGWRNIFLTFNPTKWEKVSYKEGMIPPEGAVLFWGPTVKNKYGHTAIAMAGSTDQDFNIIEQNGLLGSALGKNGDEILIRTISKNDRGPFLGYYIFKKANTMKVGSSHNYAEILKKIIADGYTPLYEKHEGDNVLTEKETKELIDIAASRILKNVEKMIEEAIKKKL